MIARVSALFLMVLATRVSAGGVNESRLPAHDQPLYGPIMRIVETHVDASVVDLQTGKATSNTYIWIKEYSRSKKLKKADFYTDKIDENCLDSTRVYDENGFLLSIDSRRSPSSNEYSGKVNEDSWTYSEAFNGKTIYQYDRDFKRILWCWRSRPYGYVPEDYRLDYHYDDQGRLTLITKEQDGLIVPYQTVFYDGQPRSFDSNYFISPTLTGHEEIEVFDGSVRVSLLVRRLVSGDIAIPTTLEGWEKKTESIEYRFDTLGNEVLQESSFLGKPYVAYLTVYTDIDVFGNWLNCKTSMKNEETGKDTPYSTWSREIAYYEN